MAPGLAPGLAWLIEVSASMAIHMFFACLLSMLDVSVLQALSKRIHYGMFVAEAKFR